MISNVINVDICPTLNTEISALRNVEMMLFWQWLELWNKQQYNNSEPQFKCQVGEA